MRVRTAFTESFGSVRDFITISSSVRDRIPRYRRLADSYLRPRIFPVLVEVMQLATSCHSSEVWEGPCSVFVFVNNIILNRKSIGGDDRS